MAGQVAVLTVKASVAAQMLGVGESTVRRWFSDKHLPGVRIGHTILINRQALEEIVAGTREVPSATAKRGGNKRRVKVPANVTPLPATGTEGRKSRMVPVR